MVEWLENGLRLKSLEKVTNSSLTAWTIDGGRDASPLGPPSGGPRYKEVPRPLFQSTGKKRASPLGPLSEYGEGKRRDDAHGGGTEFALV
jgi:hypothetical protein